VPDRESTSAAGPGERPVELPSDPTQDPEAEDLGTRRHSFIVRIWLEDRDVVPRRVRWRGTVTHVPGGERGAVKRLADVSAFIAPYLWSMGVRPSLPVRLAEKLYRAIRRSEPG
jgi:hypothetical protein